MIVLVCGDRHYTSEATIRRELVKLYDYQPTILHGACVGADTIGGLIAEELGYPVMVFPAQWHKYGRSAGPIRNNQMLTEGKPELVLAFHSDITASKGTANMVKISNKAGIPVYIFP